MKLLSRWRTRKRLVDELRDHYASPPSVVEALTTLSPIDGCISQAVEDFKEARK